MTTEPTSHTTIDTPVPASSASTHSPIFARLRQQVQTGATATAFQDLFAHLRQHKEFARLFEAKLLQARAELQLPLIETRSTKDWPEDRKRQYEDQIMRICREIGALYLAEQNYLGAYQYYDMIGEFEPLRQALAQLPLTISGTLLDTVLELTLTRGLDPVKGLELVRHHYGTCQLITACEQFLGPGTEETLRQESLQLVVRTLHAELVERLTAAIHERQPEAATPASVPLLLKGRDWLFEDDNYHIDPSHLNAVVRMARLLPAKCQELFLAIQLCEYGLALSPKYRYDEPEPFAHLFRDSHVYLKALTGTDMQAAQDHFAQKLTQVDEEELQLAREWYVRLLYQMGRYDQALEAAAQFFNESQIRTQLCPSINEICLKAQRLDRFTTLAEQRHDPASYLAGLLATQNS